MNDFNTNFMEIFITYEEAFSSEVSPNENFLIKKIEEVPLNGALDIISLILSEKIDRKEVEEPYISFYKGLLRDYDEKEEVISKKVDLLRNNNLYSPQSLLYLSKWLLSHCKKEELLNKPERDSIDKSIIYLNFISASIIDKKYNSESVKETSYGLLRNYIFNQQEKPYQLLARTKYIYVELAKQKKLYNEKEYVDFNRDFKDSYGYTIMEFLTVIFALIGHYNSKNNKGLVNWRLDINNYFSKTNIPDLGKKILRDISISFEDAISWSEKNKESIWNYFKYQEYPLLEITKNKVIPFMPIMLYDLIFEGLYHKIRNCYSYDNKDFISFFGRPFEEYGYEIIKNAVDKSFLEYRLIKEFRYGDDNSKKSPDIILELDNKILVIEIKSARFKLKTVLGEIDNENDPLKDDLNKMVIKPLKQSHDRIKEIINNNEKELANVEDVYLMSVTMDSIPKFPYFNEIIDEKLQEHFTLPIKSYYQIDINEFEHLCYLISRKKRKGKPVFHYLDLRDRYDNFSFINFLNQTSQPIRNLNIMDEKTEEIKAEFKEIVFGSAE